MRQNNTSKKIAGKIAVIVILSVCLCISTFALYFISVDKKGNFFKTGKVQININDEKPIITENEFLFEPGMTVKRDFFVENESTADIYYKIYLKDVSGGLADELIITVKDKEKELLSGKAGELCKKDNIKAFDEILTSGERKVLTMEFYYPAESAFSQNKDLKFTVCADAVQARNNTERLF